MGNIEVNGAVLSIEEKTKHSSKSIVMSISVKPETQDLLKVAAKKSGRSVSDLVRVLVEKHLSLVVNDGNDIPVVLRIPSNLKEDGVALKTWLDSRSEGLVKMLVKS